MGRRIAALRLACGVTQERLAEGAGVDARYLQRIEAGEKNITIETLVKIANVLRVGVASLFAEEPAPVRGARASGSGGKRARTTLTRPPGARRPRPR